MKLNPYDKVIKKFRKSEIYSPLANYLDAGFMRFDEEKHQIYMSDMGHYFSQLTFRLDVDSMKLSNLNYNSRDLSSSFNEQALKVLDGKELDSFSSELIYSITNPAFENIQRNKEQWTKTLLYVVDHKTIIKNSDDEDHWEGIKSIVELAGDYMYGYGVVPELYWHESVPCGFDPTEYHLFIGNDLAKFYPPMSSIDINISTGMISGIPQIVHDAFDYALKNDRYGVRRFMCGLGNLLCAMIRGAQEQKDKYQKALVREKKLRKLFIMYMCGGMKK